MSGYSDDRDDELDRREDRRDIRVAKSKVSAPAIGLIVTAAFGRLGVVLGVVQYHPRPPVRRAGRADRGEPAVHGRPKKEQVQMMNQFRGRVKG